MQSGSPMEQVLEPPSRHRLLASTSAVTVTREKDRDRLLAKG